VLLLSLARTLRLVRPQHQQFNNFLKKFDLVEELVLGAFSGEGVLVAVVGVADDGSFWFC
jgi:hypothetical protein